MPANGQASADPEGAEVRRRVDQAMRLLRVDDADTVRRAIDELAIHAAVGNQSAVRALLQVILDRRLARRAVSRILLDPADVADAEQNTLIAVAERISSFEGRARFTTWLETVARNEALMLLRRQQRKSEPVSNELPEADRSARRLSSLIADEQVLQHALGQLSVEHRTVILLRENDGFSYEEIAAQLGVPIGTVRSRINRARQSLAALLLGQN